MADRNQWDERYRRTEFIYGREPNDFRAAELKAIPADGKVLFGRGSGAELASSGYAVPAVGGATRP